MLGYITVFLLGGVLGIVGTCCLVANKDEDN